MAASSEHLVCAAETPSAYIALVSRIFARCVTACALVASVACAAMVGGCVPRRAVVLGFWFETVTYRSSRFGGPLTAEELQTIASVARSEVAHAFSDLRLTVSNRKDARYRVRVLQQLHDPRFRGHVGVAGASRAVSMFAGDGAVNFSLLAGYAESYATADADRATIVTAIGRGVGRAAVHEFAHQLLGTALIDDGDDAQSYEFGSAARREQYYGQMHWRGAWPALYKRFGRRELRGAANRSHAAPVRLPRAAHVRGARLSGAVSRSSISFMVRPHISHCVSGDRSRSSAMTRTVPATAASTSSKGSATGGSLGCGGFAVIVAAPSLRSTPQ
jgi:hypothetical protein